MKIIASDFDGTIQKEGKISDRDKKAVFDWQKNGNHFGIVTGRGPEILEIVKNFGLKLDYAIAYNGALVLDSDGNILYEDWFKRGVAREYYEFAHSSEYEFVHSYEPFDEKEDEIKEYQITLLPKDKHNSREVAAMLNEKFKGKLSAYTNGQWIDTVKYGTSKATGIKHYAELKNIDQKDIYTVGDAFNDLPMIQAFNGYVVDSCHPELKKIVPNVCKDIAHLTELAYKK